MQTVRDDSGTRYLLVKRSRESSLVRDPETGEERHLPNDRFEAIDEAPLDAVGNGAIPSSIRRLVTAAPDGRALGLLVEIDARGPVTVRALLADYDLCESDLHGLLGEFRAAGLVDETETGGERGYDTTKAGRAALDRLRDPDD